ncbi:MAG: ATP-binding protein, partial [Cyanobacteria bacterium J06650_10]
MVSAVEASMGEPSSVIGTVKGPGENGNQYVFITSDNRQVKIGEFVYYEVSSPADSSSNSSSNSPRSNKPLQILGKISDRRLSDHLPDRMFADAQISPEAIAAIVGFAHANPEIYEVTVDVIGYFNPALGFINPRLTPNPGAQVSITDDETLKRVVNKKQPGEVGSAQVGSLLLRPGGAVPVALDVKELVSTHMAILAGTGSGKSYTAGVLIEEFLQPYNRAAVLIFDPHGEYGTLTEMRGHSAFQAVDGYAPDVRILTPDDITIR